jgi:hypothetical protein
MRSNLYIHKNNEILFSITEEWIWVCTAVSCRNERYQTFSKIVKKKIDAYSQKPSMTNNQQPA